MRLLWTIVAFALALGATCAPSYTVLFDSDAGYLQNNGETINVDAAGLGGILSALTGLMPSAEVDAQTVREH